MDQRQGRHGAAIGVMCLGILGLVLSDSAAKDLVTRYDPLQIMFARSCMALPLVTLIVLRAQGLSALRSAKPQVHLLRTLLSLGATFTFFSSLRGLPLAGATALALTAPLFVTALSVPLLGEKVGRLRWGALVVGFAGAMVIVQPGAQTLQPAALFALGAALCYALMMMASRWIDGRDTMWTVMFYLTALPLALTSWTVLTDWPPITRMDLALFGTMALVGTLGITLITQAFRMAPAAIVAPFDYTALIWASATGWLFWGELPGAATYIGAVIIVAAGLFVIWREARVARSQPPAGVFKEP